MRFTGGCSSTISLRLSEKVWFISWFTSAAFGVLFFISSSSNCLLFSNADASWPGGKLGRKFVSLLVGFFRLFAGGSPSGFSRVLLLPLTDTSAIPHLHKCSLSLTCKKRRRSQKSTQSHFFFKCKLSLLTKFTFSRQSMRQPIKLPFMHNWQHRR